MDLQFDHPEFEEEVRKERNIFDRPITKEDALLVSHLDLSNFDFRLEDMETLSVFKNLRYLDVNMWQSSPEFWRNFPHLEELYVCVGDDFDFASFQNMKELSYLFVSGGDYSGIDYLNLEALLPLEKLRELHLHEFGSVDLLPIASMPQLRLLGVHYADKIHNIDIIGSLSQLEELRLTGLYVDSLDFLDQLPDRVRLDMCGIHVYGGVDPQKWKRFAVYDICDISVKDKSYEMIDLSALDNYNPFLGRANSERVLAFVPDKQD